MKFKGTYFFALIVALVAGYAIYDYKKNADHEIAKTSEHHAYKGQSVENVKNFSLKNPSGGFRLTNENGSWKVTEPLQATTDRQAVESLLFAIFSQNLKPLETESSGSSAEQVQQFGLDKPTYKIDITFNDGKTSSLEFGSVRAYDESFYVRKDGVQIFLGEIGWDALLTKTVDDLRDKTLYANAGEVTSFSVKSKDGSGFKFARVDGKWSLDKQPAFRVDDMAIDDFINKVRHLKADHIVSEDKSPSGLRQYSLMPEQADTVITLGFAETPKEEWQVVIAATKTDRAYVYSTSSSSIFEIGVSKLAGLRSGVSHFRNKFYPFQFDPALAHQVRILKKGDANEMRYTKMNGQWEIDVENPHLKLDPVKVDGWVDSLRNLQTVKYFGRGKWTSKEIQENRIQVLNQAQQQVFLLEWGGDHRENETDYYLVKTNLADEVMAVAKGVIDEIANRKLLKE